MSSPAGQQPGPGRLGLTTRIQVVAALLSGAVIGYLIIGGFDLANETVPFTPWSLPTMLAALAGAAWLYSRTLRRQVREARGTLAHEAGVRALVLGKTLVATGLALAGGHIAYLLRFVGDMAIEGPRQRVLRGLVTVLVGLGLAWAGSRLERACLVDLPTDDDEPDDSAADAER